MHIFLSILLQRFLSNVSTEPATDSFFRTHGNTEKVPVTSSLVYFGMNRKKSSFTAFLTVELLFLSTSGHILLRQSPTPVWGSHKLLSTSSIYSLSRLNIRLLYLYFALISNPIGTLSNPHPTSSSIQTHLIFRLHTSIFIITMNITISTMNKNTATISLLPVYFFVFSLTCNIHIHKALLPYKSIRFTAKI